MKLNILLASLLIGNVVQAKVITENHALTEPAFSKLIYQAYASDDLLNPDGSFTFPRGFSCQLNAGVPACELLAQEWDLVEGTTSVRGRMFTPVTEDAVFDLMEYMKVPAVETEDENGVVSRTKTLSVTVQDKAYELICNEVGIKGEPNPELRNCVLYNGVNWTADKPTSSL